VLRYRSPTYSGRVTADVDRPPATARALRVEVLLVLGLSLGQSALYAVVDLAAKLTAPGGLSRQTATLNPSQSPRPYVDLAYQLLRIAFDLVPVVLAGYLLARDRMDPRRALGVDLTRPGADAAWGTGLAAGIGIPGLLLVYAAGQLGLNAKLVPAALPHVWWAVPVLLLAAFANAALEEVIVVGYLLTRLRQLGLRPAAMVAASALLRGSYHLYQGFGAFVGNAVMGVVFALFFLRKGRVLPLVVAHTLLDVAAFVGYTVVPRGWLSWLGLG
jgi:uncharacterized protein